MNMILTIRQKAFEALKSGGLGHLVNKCCLMIPVISWGSYHQNIGKISGYGWISGGWLMISSGMILATYNHRDKWTTLAVLNTAHISAIVKRSIEPPRIV